MKWKKIVERKESVLMIDYLIRGLPKKITKKVLNYDIGYEHYLIIQDEIFWDEEEAGKVKEKLLKDISLKKIDLNKFVDIWLKKGNSLLKYAIKILKYKFNKYDNKELLKIFKEFSKKNHEFSCSLLLPLTAELILEEKIKNILSKLSEEKREKYFLILTTPSSKSESTEELISFLKIAVYIQKNKIKNLKKNKRVLSLIKKHIKEFGWINTRWYIGREWTIEELITRLKVILNTDCQKELKKLTLFYRNNKKETQNIIKELNFDEEKKELIATTKKYVFIRTYRTDIFNKAGFITRPLFYEISKRMNISYEEFIHLSTKEIFNFLDKGIIVKKNEIKNRLKSFASLLKDNDIKVFSGKEINSFRKRYLGKQQIEEVNELKGAIANKGFAKGIAKIVKGNKELFKVKKKDILIAPMTTPDFVPAMERASAFVTDEGGILCHAAIVSREMNKPCIIGTKIATKVFKDGDLIEVDANKGVVKKVK